MDDPLIFLDLDGVLTSKEETPGSYHTNPTEDYGLSPSCMKAFNELCKKTNSKIVIISSWRQYGIDAKFGQWEGEKIPSPLYELRQTYDDIIIDMIPYSGLFKKAPDLIDWMDENDVPEHFVILDDDKREHLHDERLYSIDKHTYLVNSDTGLTMQDVPQIIKILKKAI